MASKDRYKFEMGVNLNHQLEPSTDPEKNRRRCEIRDGIAINMVRQHLLSLRRISSAQHLIRHTNAETVLQKPYNCRTALISAVRMSICEHKTIYTNVASPRSDGNMIFKRANLLQLCPLRST